MERMISGRVYTIPDDSGGRADLARVRREMGLTPKEVVIEARADGASVILPHRGVHAVRPGSHLLRAPLIERG